MQAVEDAAQPPRHQTMRAVTDVGLDQLLDPWPERRHEHVPGFLHAHREQLARGGWISDEGLEHDPERATAARRQAELELVLYLLERCGSDLGELLGNGRGSMRGRRRHEVRHPSRRRMSSEERVEVEPSRRRPDCPMPGLVEDTRALVDERAHGEVRLPRGRAGEAHAEQVVVVAEDDPRHLRQHTCRSGSFDQPHVQPDARRMAVSASGEPRKVRFGDALASAEFRALFAAFAISLTGSVVSAVALTVLVYQRTNSSLLASLTFALGFLPYLVSGALLSAVVDRIPLAAAARRLRSRMQRCSWR